MLFLSSLCTWWLIVDGGRDLAYCAFEQQGAI